MKNIISATLIAASLMFISAPTQADQVTGTVSYFYTNGTTTGMIVNGLFYYSNNLAPAVITSIDLSRRTQNGVVTFSASPARVIDGAY